MSTPTLNAAQLRGGRPMKPFHTVAFKGGLLGWTWPKTWAAVRAGRAFWDLEAAKYAARDAWQGGRAKAGLPYVAVTE